MPSNHDRNSKLSCAQGNDSADQLVSTYNRCVFFSLIFVSTSTVGWMAPLMVSGKRPYQALIGTSWVGCFFTSSSVASANERPASCRSFHSEVQMFSKN